MTFGIFDGLDEGHKRALAETRSLGHRVTVVVTRDAVVRKLEGHDPKRDLRTRLEAVKKLGVADDVAAGGPD